jgi:hypothetical protein
MRIVIVGDPEGPKPDAWPGAEEERYVDVTLPDDMSLERLRSMNEDEAVKYLEGLG